MVAPRVTPITSVSVPLDATGTGRATLGPAQYGTSWEVARMVTNTTRTDTTVGTKLLVYQGQEAASTLVDMTDVADQDVSETDITLQAGEVLTFVWSVGEPGSIATAIVYGAINTGREVV